MPKSIYYPQHCMPSAAAHSHWLVSDGHDIPNRDDVLDYLKMYAQALSIPLPSDPLSRPHTLWWIDSQAFSTAMYALMQHFGFEDCGVEVADKAKDGVKRFVLDTAAMNAATGCSWPSWSDWLGKLELETPRMLDYLTTNSLHDINWRALIWEQGVNVRRNNGYRLRPLPSMQGETEFDDYVRFLIAHPALLVAADSWAQRISRSTFLDDMVRAGSIGTDGWLVRSEDINRDVDSVSLLLGFQPKSSESTKFDKKFWPFWVYPLMRKAFVLKSQSRVVVQKPYIYTTPIASDPASTECALRVSMVTREHRMLIGSLMDHLRLSEAFAQTRMSSSIRSTSDITSHIQEEITAKSQYLRKGREIVQSVSFELCGFLQEAAKSSFEEVILPVDLNVFLTTNATRRITPAFAKPRQSSVGSIVNAADQGISAEHETTTDAGEVSVGVTQLDLEGDDVNEILDGLLGRKQVDEGKEEPRDDDSELDRWGEALQADIHDVCRDKAQELYRMFMAVSLCIRRGGLDDDPPKASGRDRMWIGPQVGAKTRESLEGQGAQDLRDMGNFGKKLVFDGYFCVSELPRLYQGVLPIRYAQAWQYNFAAILSVMFLTEKPYLYPTVIDHMTDIATEQASKDGCHIDGLGVLNSLGEYGNGLGVAATVGMRTSNPREATTPRQWIRGLLYPTAAIRNLPFGWGPRLACIGCSGDHSKSQDFEGLQNTSGFGGTINSVRLRDRLSISVFATRRGINSDHTRAVGRTSFFPCLVALIYLWYTPEFVVIFVYFATIVHRQDKAARGKSTIVLTSSGYRPASS